MALELRRAVLPAGGLILVVLIALAALPAMLPKEDVAVREGLSWPWTSAITTEAELPQIDGDREFGSVIQGQVQVTWQNVYLDPDNFRCWISLHRLLEHGEGTQRHSHWFLDTYRRVEGPCEPEQIAGWLNSILSQFNEAEQEMLRFIIRAIRQVTSW